jgi:hypothetical protein
MADSAKKEIVEGEDLPETEGKANGAVSRELKSEQKSTELEVDQLAEASGTATQKTESPETVETTNTEPDAIDAGGVEEVKEDSKPSEDAELTEGGTPTEATPDDTKGAEGSNGPVPTELAEPAEPAETIEPPQPVEPEHGKPVEPVDPSEPAKPAEAGSGPPSAQESGVNLAQDNTEKSKARKSIGPASTSNSILSRFSIIRYPSLPPTPVPSPSTSSLPRFCL